MSAYYNEFDKRAAAWLRELIADGLIAPGVVDERSIADVRPGDLAGFRQCHFFAGVGVWSYALRRAGWPDDRPVWSGSCPCPPFSSAGKEFRCPVCNTPSPVPNAVRTGAFDCIRCGHEWQADDRHLWPEFFRLIRQCRPELVLGEQVSSKDGLTWVDVVRASMEMVGYAFGHTDTPASGFGAPNIRQRLYWVGHTASGGLGEQWGAVATRSIRHADGAGGAFGIVGHTERAGLAQRIGIVGVHGGTIGTDAREAAERTGVHAGWMADTLHSERRQEHERREDGRNRIDGGREEACGDIGACGEVRGMADSERERHDRSGSAGSAGQRRDDAAGCPVPAGGMADTDSPERTSRDILGCGSSEGREGGVDALFHGGDRGRPGPVNGFWRAADWLLCRDGRWRAARPGSQPLVNGAARGMVPGSDPGSPITLPSAEGRVMRLRGYGNAINAEQARHFIECVREILEDQRG